MFTCLLFIRTALRTLVNISAIGSLKLIFVSLVLSGAFDAAFYRFSPACLFDPGYLSFVGQLSEAKPANFELPINSPGPAAKLAAGVLPYPELLFHLDFIFKGLG
jgi:hypothetical protein